LTPTLTHLPIDPPDQSCFRLAQANLAMAFGGCRLVFPIHGKTSLANRSGYNYMIYDLRSQIAVFLIIILIIALKPEV
jgi:hypothetical protein